MSESHCLVFQLIWKNLDVLWCQKITKFKPKIYSSTPPSSCCRSPPAPISTHHPVLISLVRPARIASSRRNNQYLKNINLTGIKHFDGLTCPKRLKHRMLLTHSLMTAGRPTKAQHHRRSRPTLSAATQKNAQPKYKTSTHVRVRTSSYRCPKRRYWIDDVLSECVYQVIGSNNY